MYIKYERIPKTTFLTYDYQSGGGHIKYECIPMKLKFFKISMSLKHKEMNVLTFLHIIIIWRRTLKNINYV